MVKNLAEQPWIATAPSVDSLLHVSDIEQAPPTFRVLHSLIDQIAQDTPLRIARVLEFVEQPVIVFRIESPIDEQPSVFHPATHRQLRRTRIGHQQPLHIRKREFACTPHEVVINRFVTAQHRMNTMRHFHTDLRRQRLLLPLDHEFDRFLA